MSNEGGNNDMEWKEQQCSEFGRAVSRIAVAQMGKSAGFQSFKESALDALADIAIKYLGHLGKISSFYANFAGRTECNVFDIIRGLEELEESSSQGFQAAWQPNHCLATSGSVMNIVRYVNSAQEIPFAHPLPPFPVIPIRKPIPSFAQMGETPPPTHVPNWLPAFPDAHTYNHSAVLWRETPREPRVEKMGKSLLGLQQRLVSCGSARSGNGGESNSFFGSCLQEMDGMSHLSAPEVFAPAIDVIQSGGLANSEDDSTKILPIKRPLVQFKLKTSRTFLGATVKLNPKMAGMKESMFWVRRDDERDLDQKRDDDRDQKKRRIENIL